MSSLKAIVSTNVVQAVFVVVGILLGCISVIFWTMFADELKQYPNLKHNFTVAISLLMVGICLLFGGFFAGIGKIHF